MQGLHQLNMVHIWTRKQLLSFKKYGVWYVPTIIAGKSVSDSAAKPRIFSPVIASKAITIGPKIQANFSKAYKAG